MYKCTIFITHLPRHIDDIIRYELNVGIFNSAVGNRLKLTSIGFVQNNLEKVLGVVL